MYASVLQFRKAAVEVTTATSQERISESTADTIIVDAPLLQSVLRDTEEIVDVSILQFQEETVQVSTTIPQISEVVQSIPQELILCHRSTCKLR